MESRLDRLLERLTNAHGGERTVALLMFAYSFLAMTSYNIVKPVGRSKFIEVFGSENLPYGLMASVALVGVLMHLYGALLKRVGRQHVIPLTQFLLSAVLVALWILLRAGAAWGTLALYLFGQVFGLLLLSQFWTLASQIYHARQAKRLFGFVGGGTCLGGALGGTITKAAALAIGQDNLLLLSTAVLLVCVTVVLRILRQPGIDSPGHVGDDAGAADAGIGTLELLGRSRHLRAVAAVAAVAAIGSAVVDQQLSMAADAELSGDAIAAFFGEITIYLSLAGFVVQVGLTRRIHSTLGISAALLLLPIGLGLSASAILVWGTLWAAGGARVFDGTLRYSLDKTTREVLFLPVPQELHFSAKPFIDVTTERVARGAAAVLILVLIHPTWGLDLDWRLLSYASLVIMGIWLVLARVAWREYRQAFRDSIGSRAIEPDRIQVAVADPPTVEALVQELASPDESAVLYAIDMLESLDKHPLITPLLLQHASPRVRARTLRALASSKSALASRWVPTIERMVQDEDVDVRAAALRALAELAHEDRLALLRRHLADSEPRVVMTAAVGLADSGHQSEADEAEAALMRLINDTQASGTPGRAEAAAALAYIQNPRFRPLLVPLLADHDTGVARHAIASASELGASDGLFVPALLTLLGHRTLKAAARRALVSYDEDIVPLLAHILHDKGEHLWIRRHIPVTLALIGGAAAVDTLIACLDDPDGFLRFKAIVALERLLRANARLEGGRDVLEAAVVKESSRYYDGLTLRQNLVRHAPEAQDSVLARALDDKLRRSLDRIFRLLGLLYRVEDVAAARVSIERGGVRQRAAAVEYLDTLLGGVVRKRVIPILDDTPTSEKVRYANLVLKSRPRELDDTLAQLVHDDDPVISVSAIHFASGRGLTSLSEDLDFVVRHRPAEDRMVVEAARRAIAVRDGGPPVGSLSATEIVDRLRHNPLFASLSIDELFRMAETGEEVRHPAGRPLHREGRRPEEVFCLLEGTAHAINLEGRARILAAVTLLHLEEVLEGRPATDSVRAVSPTVGFRIPAPVFLTMLSDNIEMAQDLFSLLLAGDGQAGSPLSCRPAPLRLGGSQTVTPTDTVRMLRHDDLLCGASSAQILALLTSAQEIRLRAGEALFHASSPPATYLIVEGGVRLESDTGRTMEAPAGALIGLLDTLAGRPVGWRATITGDGRAFRLTRDDLFGVLADEIDLMQGLFGRVLALRQHAATLDSSTTIAASRSLEGGGTPWN